MVRKINIDNERDYENRKKLEESTRAQQTKFYWATSLPSQQHKLRVINNIVEKSVLEIGCSDGAAALEYTKKCASYVGVDISNIAIDLANYRKISNARFMCLDAHKLPFENESFDVVIVTALLHHLDISVAINEIHRVLKKDGLFLFLEPLGTNPLFTLYRNKTPEARTIDERPLIVSDINLIKNKFIIDESFFFGFLSLLSAFIRVEKLRKILTDLDGILLKGPMRFLAWQFCGVARKIV